MYKLQHGDSRNKRNAEDIWRIEIPDEVIERIKNLYHFEETGEKKNLSCVYGTRNEE